MTQHALTRQITRQTNYDKRNQRIRAAYELRYTNQPKPKIYTKAYIVSQLAEEFYLSMSTIEDILYK